VQNLNAVIVGVAHYDTAVTGDANPAKCSFKLSVAATFATDAADVRSIGVIPHLHAMI
jgi:hypothetical protein